MHRSRKLVSLFLLSVLVLAACQSGATPTPEVVASLLPTDSPPPTDIPPPTATPTLTPTATPTATPTQFVIEPGQCVQLIENGDFETGAIEPWIFASNLGNPGIANFRPGSGQYSVVLGDGLNADDYLELDVSLPANAVSATFTFLWNGATQETDNQPHDVLNLSLETPDGQILTALQKFDNATIRQSPEFAKVTHDLTSYAGQTIRISFHVQTDGQNRSDFSIDNVSLEACGGALETATATPTPPPAASPTEATLGKGECVELIQNGDFETGSITGCLRGNQ